MIVTKVEIVDLAEKVLAGQLAEISRTLLWAAARTEELAKLEVPVDTGNLKASIHVDQLSPFETIVAAGGPAALYAAHVEFGHATPGGGHWPGHPYLGPAFAEVAPELKARLS
ncbi:MAG: HK97 gp10 family phage protein [Dehalococcoidia bacterium]